MDPVFDQIFNSRSWAEFETSSLYDENDDHGDYEDIMDFYHEIRLGLAESAGEIVFSQGEHLGWGNDWDEE